MRISDWSSDVCSSDLGQAPRQGEDGRPRAIDEADLPAGAERAEIQGITICQTYVTKSAPSDGATATTGKGSELKPLIHPDDIFLETKSEASWVGKEWVGTCRSMCLTDQ